MKTFENGQKVLARLDEESSYEEYDYIGTIPNFSPRPHAVRNDTLGLKAICDWNIKAAPVKKEGWVNIYRRKSGVTWNSNTHESEEEAARMRLGGDGKPDPEYVATVRIEWEE